MSDLPPDPEDKPGDDPKDDKPKDHTFTQAELDRIAANRAKEGKQAGQRELLEALGVTDVEEAKEILKKHREDEDARRSESERAAAAARQEKEAAEAERREARRERLAARIERALGKAGVPESEIEFVAKMVEVDDDADPDAVQQAVDDLKEKMPRLFEAKKDGEEGEEPGKGSKRTRPKEGDPGKPPRTPPPGDPKERAKSRLASRHPKTAKT